jgi:hypothetical protein
MKLFFLALIALPLYSNTFELKDTSARFKLEITPKELRFESEIMTKKFILTPCSLEFARELNDEFLGSIEVKDSDLDLWVDGKKLRGPSSLLTIINEKILAFSLKEQEICQ